MSAEQEDYALASDPLTPPEVLASIAQRSRRGSVSWRVLNEIGTNPNASAATLLWLHDNMGVTSILDNPSLPMHVLTGDMPSDRIADVWITWLERLPTVELAHHIWPASLQWEKKRRIVGVMKRPRKLYAGLSSSTNNRLRFYIAAAARALESKGLSRTRILYEIDLERHALFDDAPPLPNEALLHTLAGA